MPDPVTGKPRPPRAPVQRVASDPRKRPTHKARYPSAPEGRGPLLEWDQERNQTFLYAGIAGSALGIGFLCLKDGGIQWMSNPWLWLCVIAIIPVFGLVGRRKGMSAGADWFHSGGTWVDTYNLTEVKVEGASAGMSWSLFLTDSDGREAGTAVDQIQRNRDLWDLVYNGILHSVQQRPDAPNKRAVEILQLQ